MKHNIVIPDKLNFTFEEFFKSDYAKQLVINNVTSDPKILSTIMTTICCLLQPIRSLCNLYDIEISGNPEPYKNYTLKKRVQPQLLGINLTGGWRSKALIDACRLKLGIYMAATGHPDGQCADITRPSWSNLYLFCVLKAFIKAGLIEVDQLIYEYDTNCCHVGYRAGNNRREIMIRKSVNGVLKYYNV